MIPARSWAPRVAATLAVLVAHAVRAQDDPSISMLEEASARYARSRTLCATFEQKLEITLLGEEHVGRGRLCQSQPDKFAMRFTDPGGDAVVVDGTWVWLYYPSTDPGQVIRLPVAEGRGRYDFHEEFLHDPAAKYDARYQGEEQVTGRATYRIRLVPKTNRSYREAVVWIDRATGTLRRVRILDENESVRTVTLDSVQLDARVPDGFFSFDPPPGVQVISR